MVDSEGHCAGGRFPWRIAIAIALGTFLIQGPWQGLQSILIPTRLAEIDAMGKASALATMSSCSTVVSAIGGIVIGSLSDHTHTRIGRRAPWMLVGSVGAMCMAFSIMFCTQIWQIILLTVLTMPFTCMAGTTIMAMIPDEVSERHRANVTALYAVGVVVGQYGGQSLATLFLGHERYGYLVLPLLMLCAGPVVTLLVRPQSNLAGLHHAGITTASGQRPQLTLMAFIHMFAFPTRGAHDFYFALVGRIAYSIGVWVVGTYQLYILTDYIQLSGDNLNAALRLMLLALMITSMTLSAVSGPISTKLGILKLPTVASAVLLVIAAAIPLYSPTIAGMVVFAVVSGLSQGIFNTTDQALNIAILPDKANAAKNLAIINLSNPIAIISSSVGGSIIIGHLGYQALFIASMIASSISIVLFLSIRHR